MGPAATGACAGVAGRLAGFEEGASCLAEGAGEAKDGEIEGCQEPERGIYQIH